MALPRQASGNHPLALRVLNMRRVFAGLQALAGTRFSCASLWMSVTPA